METTTNEAKIRVTSFSFSDRAARPTQVVVSSCQSPSVAKAFLFPLGKQDTWVTYVEFTGLVGRFCWEA